VCSVAHKIKYNSSAEAANLLYPSSPILLQMHMQHLCDAYIIIPCCVWQHIDVHCCTPDTVETKLSVIRSLQDDDAASGG
jgi:hypothetical protein